MLLPYNVDRRVKGTPYVTYSLMALNIFFFLLSVTVANLQRSEDDIAAKREIAVLLQNDRQAQMMNEFVQSLDDSSAMAEEGTPDKDELANEIQKYRALELLIAQPRTPDFYVKAWQIQHLGEGLVTEPHWTVSRWLAYTPGNPNALHRLLSMLSAMFMHGSIDHIFGNMLFLWVFGRAAEEFLGRKFYLAVYLAAGFGATLMHHLMAQFFAPGTMLVPSLGASGAIAGVLGLFVVRFFRTKVRMFYLLPGIAYFIFGAAAMATLWVVYLLLGVPELAAILAFIAGSAAVFFAGKDRAWGARWVRSVWVIGAWVIVANLLPAMLQMYHGAEGGGVAYWAHIGGFILGAVYAFAIGGVDEGKDEYLLEDAQKALETTEELKIGVPGGKRADDESGADAIGGTDAAFEKAIALLQKDPNNARAHEVMARAYAKRKATEMARRHFEKTLVLFLQQKEEAEALRVFQLIILTDPEMPLGAPTMWALSRGYATRAMWNETATLLTRIIEEHPSSSEAEIALFRSAQLWGRQFDDPGESARQFEMFLERYPQSQNFQQAQMALTQARTLAAQREP